MQSYWNPTDFNSRSCWDEPRNIKNGSVHLPNAKTTIQSSQVQLLGVVGVLLVTLVIVIPITFVMSGIKGNTTLSYSTTVTTATTTVNPYACGNMTFYNNTDLAGANISPTLTLNYTGCCSNCLMTSGCVGFTVVLSGNACYRKSATGNVSTANQVSARY